MKIIKIQKLKDGRYNLFFSNQMKIITYDEVILKYNLLTQKEIDDSLFQEIEEENLYYKNYRKVFSYAKLRLRSQKELIEYMKKLMLTEEAKNRVIKDLKRFGFYNDDNFLRAFVADKMNLTNWGPNKIKLELLNHDIEEEKIDDILKKIPYEEIEEKLRRQLVKKCSSNYNNSTMFFKKKLIYEFTKLGYESELILSILEGFSFDEKRILLHEFMKVKKVLEKKYDGTTLSFQIKQKLYRKGFSTDEINQIIEENMN